MSVESVAVKAADAGQLRSTAHLIGNLVGPGFGVTRATKDNHIARLRALADVLEKITPQGVEVLRMAVGNLPHGFSPDDGEDDAAAESVLAALDELTQ